MSCYMLVDDTQGTHHNQFRDLLVFWAPIEVEYNYVQMIILCVLQRDVNGCYFATFHIFLHWYETYRPDYQRHIVKKIFNGKHGWSVRLSLRLSHKKRFTLMKQSGYLFIAKVDRFTIYYGAVFWRFSLFIASWPFRIVCGINL